VPDVRKGLFDTILKGTGSFLGQARAFRDGEYVRIATGSLVNPFRAAFETAFGQRPVSGITAGTMLWSQLPALSRRR